jgi:thiol:disulfide interchange protein/DsbC/DsbD-like thiol-disulfide interchange protein
LQRSWIRGLSLMWVLLPAMLHAAAVKTEHVSAELVAQRSAVQPGQSVQVGLLLQHIPHWHSYWRNPGDSGLPTTLTWTLPPQSQIGEIEWPAPKRLPIGPLVNYGYEGEVLLPMSFTAPSNARPGEDLRLSAKATWLVCKDVCIPEEATLELRLPVVGTDITPGSTQHTPLFERTAAELALPVKGWSAAVQRSGRELLLTLDADASTALPGALPAVHVFPYAEQLIEPARHELYRTPRGYAVKLALLGEANAPSELKGIAVAQGAAAPWGAAQRAIEFTAPWRTVTRLELPAGAQRLDELPATMRSAAPAPVGATLWSALLLAFVGGMLLNLMPCVFPVLSMKLLSLAKQAPHAAALRTHAFAYGGGVLLSFMALAIALTALQAAGSAVGWGFQLQEPGVVFLLALLFFAIGLNLMGALEFASLLPQRLAQWRTERPSTDAFACGVLAVVAASPCTAPFMGAALGFALTQSTAMALAVFAALGLGMALPYMLLTLLPGWRRRLPKPGSWMLHLKQGLAFPMFATAVWLLWVLGQQAGVGAMARLLLAVVGLGLLVWLGGLGAAKHWGGKALGALLTLAVLAWSWPTELPVAAQSEHAGTARVERGAWQNYDEAALADFVAQGRPVFVDFTAAWCVSCQVNKRLVLHNDETLQAFAQSKVVLMRADWTRRDAVITQALARLGRNGVPVYVLMRPGREPLLLPEILSQGSVRDALATLSPSRS